MTRLASTNKTIPAVPPAPETQPPKQKGFLARMMEAVAAKVGHGRVTTTLAAGSKPPSLRSILAQNRLEKERTVATHTAAKVRQPTAAAAPAPLNKSAATSDDIASQVTAASTAELAQLEAILKPFDGSQTVSSASVPSLAESADAGLQAAFKAERDPVKKAHLRQLLLAGHTDESSTHLDRLYQAFRQEPDGNKRAKIHARICALEQCV